MNQLDYVTRQIVRAAAFRAMRHAPVWLSIAILIAAYLAEHVR
jgi:hypothetical protein